MTIPAGRYMARAIAGSEQYGRTSNGNPQIGIDMQIAGGELEGTTATTILIFTPKTQDWCMRRLRALGWQGDDLMALTGIDANEVPILVKYEEYQGEQKMKVEIDVGGGRFEFQQKMNDAEKRKFAAEFKGLAMSTKPAAAGPQQPVGNGTGRPSF